MYWQNNYYTELSSFLFVAFNQTKNANMTMSWCLLCESLIKHPITDFIWCMWMVLTGVIDVVTLLIMNCFSKHTHLLSYVTFHLEGKKKKKAICKTYSGIIKPRSEKYSLGLEHKNNIAWGIWKHELNNPVQMKLHRLFWANWELVSVMGPLRCYYKTSKKRWQDLFIFHMWSDACICLFPCVLHHSDVQHWSGTYWDRRSAPTFLPATSVLSLGGS